MVTCSATKSSTYQAGDVWIIGWGYSDKSSGEIVDPTSFTAKLFDGSDVQRLVADTSQTTTGTVVPTKDTDGSVTGTAGWYYLTITSHSGASSGTWYIETTFTHETVTDTLNICFSVVAAGAGVVADGTTGTSTVYAHPIDVRNFLLTVRPFDANSTVPDGIIEQYIAWAESEFEERTGTAYKPVLVTDEEHDLEAWRGRHRELFEDSWYSVPRPVHLNHRPILPFDTSRGHKIELYEGSDSSPTTADPIGDWGTDYVTGKTYGRDSDWDLSWDDGVLNLRKAFLFRRHRLVRVTYEFGKPIATTTGTTLSDASTVNMSSTFRYQTRGFVRMGTEWIFHTGKTATSLTGCRKGQFGSQSQEHVTGTEVYEVPPKLNRLVAMRAASHYLRNNKFIVQVADSSDSSPSYEKSVEAWDKEWETYLSEDNQRWTLL